jgi:signal transduction histidine kinase
MKPQQKLRTNTARLAAGFGGALLVATFLPFLLIYVQVTVALPGRIDRYLEHEIVRLNPADIIKLLTDLRRRDVADLHRISLAGLFTPAGVVLDGNLQALPVGLVADQRAHATMVRAWPDRVLEARVVRRKLDDGTVLLIGSTTWALNAMRSTLVYALFLWVLPLAVVAFSFCLVLIQRSSARIRMMHRTTQRIVSGALGERLPVSSGGDEVDALAVSINDMLDEMERLMGQLRNFGNNIAHDIRGPLTRMKARLDGCRSVCRDEYLANSLEECAGDIGQALRVVTALLRLIEIDAERRRSAFCAIRLDFLVEQLAELYGALAVAQGIVLSVRTHPCTIWGDADLLSEALANLIDNAIKFTPDGGRIFLATTHGNGIVSVRVADTGIGMAAHERELVIHRFYRADRSRALPGSGLGLALVDAIARLHDARLVISDANPGSCVELSFCDQAEALFAAPQHL